MSEELGLTGRDVFYLVHFKKGGMKAHAAYVRDPVTYMQRVREERFASGDIVAEITGMEFLKLECPKEDRRP